MAAPGYAAADLLAVAGMLGMGTIKTLLSKLMYGIQTRGIDGTVHSFEARPPGERLLASRPALARALQRPTLLVSAGFSACTARPTGARVSALPHRRSATAHAARAHERSAPVPRTGANTRRIARCRGAAPRCCCGDAASGRFGRRRCAQRGAMTFLPSHCCSESPAAAVFRPFAPRRSLGICV